MNLRIATGFLTHAATAAYTPPAQGAAPIRKLIFDLHVRCGADTEYPERCVIEEPALQKTAEAKLAAGAFVLIEGEPIARPFLKNGVQTGWSREVLVRKIEFIRVPKAAQTTAGEEEAA